MHFCCLISYRQHRIYLGPNFSIKLCMTCASVRFSGKSGSWIDKAMNVIEKANMASLKEMMCSSLKLVCIAVNV
jgi:hypothetical protein